MPDQKWQCDLVGCGQPAVVQDIIRVALQAKQFRRHRNYWCRHHAPEVEAVEGLASRVQQSSGFVIDTEQLGGGR